MEDYLQRKKRAKNRILARKAFKAHLLIYIATIPLLVAINLVTAPEFRWWVFPVFGWGFVVVLHYIINYLVLGSQDPIREREELEREMEHLEMKEIERLDLDSDYTLPKKDKSGGEWDDQDFV